MKQASFFLNLAIPIALNIRVHPPGAKVSGHTLVHNLALYRCGGAQCSFTNPEVHTDRINSIIHATADLRGLRIPPFDRPDY